MKTETVSVHPLYQSALAADAAYSQACTDAGYKDRWHRPEIWNCPQTVRDAYDAKVAADAAWLSEMRKPQA